MWEVQAEYAVVAHLKCHPIAEIQQLEHRLQLVIAILPAAGNMQEQVQFGGSQELGGLRSHQSVFSIYSSAGSSVNAPVVQLSPKKRRRIPLRGRVSTTSRGRLIGPYWRISLKLMVQSACSIVVSWFSSLKLSCAVETGEGRPLIQ